MLPSRKFTVMWYEENNSLSWNRNLDRTHWSDRYLSLLLTHVFMNIFPTVVLRTMRRWGPRIDHCFNSENFHGPVNFICFDVPQFLRSCLANRFKTQLLKASLPISAGLETLGVIVICPFLHNEHFKDKFRLISIFSTVAKHAGEILRLKPDFML